MEKKTCVARDAKWLLPAIDTGDGRCLRRKIKPNTLSQEEPPSSRKKPCTPKQGTNPDTSDHSTPNVAKKKENGKCATNISSGKRPRKVAESKDELVLSNKVDKEAKGGQKLRQPVDKVASAQKNLNRGDRGKNEPDEGNIGQDISEDDSDIHKLDPEFAPSSAHSDKAKVIKQTFTQNSSPIRKSPRPPNSKVKKHLKKRTSITKEDTNVTATGVPVSDSVNTSTCDTEQTVKSSDKACPNHSPINTAKTKGKKGQGLQGKYSCNFCGDYFVTEAHLAEHIKWLHADVAKSRIAAKKLDGDKVVVTNKETIKVGAVGGDKIIFKEEFFKRDINARGEICKDTAEGESTLVESVDGSVETVCKEVVGELIADITNTKTGTVLNLENENVKIHVMNSLMISKCISPSLIDPEDNTLSSKCNENYDQDENKKSEAVRHRPGQTEEHNVNNDTSESKEVPNTKHSENKSEMIQNTIDTENEFGVMPKTIGREDKTGSVDKSKLLSTDTILSSDAPLFELDKTAPVDNKTMPDIYDKFIPESVEVVPVSNLKPDSCMCPFCQRWLSSAKAVKAHVELHCKETPFRCEVCHKGLFREDQEHKHAKTPDLTKQKKYYIKQVNRQNAYTCKRCSRGFTYQITLENHLLVCKGGEDTDSSKQKKKCTICSKMIAPSYMPSHMKHHENKRKHICDVCNKGFNTRAHVLGHIQSAHEQTKHFTCQHCGCNFTQKAALQRHQTVLFGKCKGDKSETAAFKCKLCSRTFTSLRWMTRHQETHILDKDSGQILAPFNCSICGKSFKNKHEHKRHYRTHTDERPHKCSECDAAFVQKGNLQAHARIHSGERPYICHVCSMAFKQQSNLKAHMHKHYCTKRIPADTAIADSEKVGKMKATLKISGHDGQIVRRDQRDSKTPSILMQVQSNTSTVDTACQTGDKDAEFDMDDHDENAEVADIDKHGQVDRYRYTGRGVESGEEIYVYIDQGTERGEDVQVDKHTELENHTENNDGNPEIDKHIVAHTHTEKINPSNDTTSRQIILTITDKGQNVAIKEVGNLDNTSINSADGVFEQSTEGLEVLAEVGASKTEGNIDEQAPQTVVNFGNSNTTLRQKLYDLLSTKSDSNLSMNTNHNTVYHFDGISESDQNIDHTYVADCSIKEDDLEGVIEAKEQAFVNDLVGMSGQQELLAGHTDKIVDKSLLVNSSNANNILFVSSMDNTTVRNPEAGGDKTVVYVLSGTAGSQIIHGHGTIAGGSQDANTVPNPTFKSSNNGLYTGAENVLQVQVIPAEHTEAVHGMSSLSSRDTTVDVLSRLSSGETIENGRSSFSSGDKTVDNLSRLAVGERTMDILSRLAAGEANTDGLSRLAVGDTTHDSLSRLASGEATEDALSRFAAGEATDDGTGANRLLTSGDRTVGGILRLTTGHTAADNSSRFGSRDATADDLSRIEPGDATADETASALQVLDQITSLEGASQLY